MQIRRYFAFLVLFFVLASLTLVTSERTVWFRGASSYKFDSYSAIDAFSRTSKAAYSDIPNVGDVSYHKAQNPWAVAYVIPQIHKDPALDSSNPGNNDAETSQKQIYGIIKSLHKNFDVNVVAVEGELINDPVEPKIDELSRKMKSRNSFQEEASILSSKIPEYARSTFNSRVASFIDGIDREIWLKGAPYKLSAEGYPISMYGLENPDTRKDATEIVRKYVYLQDRVNQGEAQIEENVSGNLSAGNISKIGQIFSLFPMGNEGRMKRDLEIIGQRVDGTGGITSNMLRNLEILLKKPKPGSTEKNIPSRSDNPYMSLTNDQAKKMLKQTEGEVEEVVSKKRSSEAAENFADILKDNGENSGIIQFGAAHVNDIIKKLNEEGISAVVISPEEVSRADELKNSDENSDENESNGGLQNAQTYRNLEAMMARYNELREKLQKLDRNSLLRFLLSRKS